LIYEHFPEVYFMTLTKKALSRSLDSMRVLANDAQIAAILERFGTEPFPYEWSEQDIYVQIQNFLGYGEFTEPAPGDFIYG
jgi:hypothetical protein